MHIVCTCFQNKYLCLFLEQIYCPELLLLVPSAVVVHSLQTLFRLKATYKMLLVKHSVTKIVEINWKTLTAGYSDLHSWQLCHLFIFLLLFFSDPWAGDVQVAKMHVLKWAFGGVCPCVCPCMCTCMYFWFPAPGCYSCCGISCYIIASISLGLLQYFFNAVLWHSSFQTLKNSPTSFSALQHKLLGHVLYSAIAKPYNPYWIQSERDRNSVLGRKGV